MSPESLARLLQNNFELVLEGEPEDGAFSIKAKLVWVDDSGRRTNRETVLETQTTVYLRRCRERDDR